jgi:hypothetical protein
MKFGGYTFVILVILIFFSSWDVFAQKKVVTKDSIVEEVVYEYDTIYVDDIRLNLDTIHLPKPIVKTIAQPEYKSFVFHAFEPKNSDTVLFFISLGISPYTTFSDFTKSSTVANITIRHNKKVSQGISISGGLIKRKWVSDINFDYKRYSELLEQTIPQTYLDTLDNGNEIFYRSIDGQLRSEIKNQYQFCQLFGELGYKFNLNRFYLLPIILIGGGYNISQKNFYLDTIALKTLAISSENKARFYAMYGASCQIGYDLKNRTNIFVNLYYQHISLKKELHPYKYRDITGLGLGITYFFKIKPYKK